MPVRKGIRSPEFICNPSCDAIASNFKRLVTIEVKLLPLSPMLIKCLGFACPFNSVALIRMLAAVSSEYGMGRISIWLFKVPPE